MPVRTIRNTWLWLPMLVLCITGPARAGGTRWESHAAIRAAARARLESLAAGFQATRIAVRVGALDPRLRLPRCPRPLATEVPDTARSRGRTTVVVRCPGEGGWSIYVSGIIDVYDRVVVLRESIARGETLTRSKLGVQERNTARLQYGYFRHPEQVVGRVARRALPSGTVLTPGSVAAPLLVRRGERVTLVATRGPVTVHTQGKALGDGSRGDRIRVRNLRSKRIVEGEVVARGVVKMTL